MTLPRGVQHQRPWSDGHRSLMVPLEPVDARGDFVTGSFVCPTPLARAEEHTSEALLRFTLIRDRVEKWVNWREKRGYHLTPPKNIEVDGPYPIPTESADDETDPDQMLYRTYAWFYRDVPLHIGLEDFLAVTDAADLYGVDLNAPVMFETPLAPTKSHIVATGPAHDAVANAQERYDRTGLRWQDLVIGDPQEPLSRDAFKGSHEE